MRVLTAHATTVARSWVRTPRRILAAENGELRRQLQFWESYIAELERELAKASAQAWDTVAEVPVRAVWESIVDSRLAGEQERTWVVWADLDQFKRVNDRFGHLAGDTVLRAVARRLEEAFAARSPVVCRLGGDEFGVLARDLDRDTDLTRFAALMAEPVALPHGCSVLVSASVGLVHAGELAPGASREDVLRRADANSYAHKPHRVVGAPSPRTRARQLGTEAIGAAR
ncbi:GGDEF domain-containing protein [Saccharopolyspora gloriosae]|uniref:GGDEF domain-containing protein n=1 Tax=Saccharopolyspora gloriosae TaxID=455344 RepID=UPI001FB6F1FA|nr:GGDEF domain-containing protein [Saccharopolyspora gloriosae]